ncbi:two component transcriptional regulator, LuxR family [Paenibacillus curdlanolyticus YK9]|uniref:Two component transcriptional regulator, LuxR family n=1 Tax=Paenibacillus curdlanolyticus YK9 TaxID=717606 RepID=E0I5G9_9BACL|nr:response regulator transcription factor [Paenibacillus curdlanolyticus]EFM12211.1 two component transcriptional regulator, LuxR family [Paenibacillus curdlanolyticus YK9]
MITILIVDDHAMVRSGLRMLLNGQADLEVIAEASDGDEGIQAALELRPNVVLMDLSMPHGKDGLTATSELKEKLPELAILVLTMHDDDEYLFRAIHAGAAGYVLKNAPHEELLTAIRSVARGDAYLYPTATKRLMNDYVERMKRGESGDVYHSLSDREKEVLGLTAKGYANKEIAEQLVISVKTVETHKSNVMEKLGLKTRPELIKYAMKKGLLQFE